MTEHVQAQLQELRTEFETGHGELEKVEQQRLYLREMLLRIGGAIQILEEVLANGQLATEPDGLPHETRMAVA